MDLISTIFLGLSFFLVLGLCWAVIDPIFSSASDAPEDASEAAGKNGGVS